MAEPTSKKATMDDAVKGMSMTELTEKMSDPKTPAPIKAAAKRRLDRISGADKTAPLSKMSKGGMPVPEDNKGLSKLPKGVRNKMGKQTGMADRKKKMSKGGMPKKYNKGGYANCGASVAGTQKK